MLEFLFFPGLHQPSDAKHFRRACISARRLWVRKKPLGDVDVFVDAASFTELALYGEFKITVAAYALLLWRLWTQGVARIVVAVSQDYMCEPFMLAKTGLTVLDHQRLTIERYDDLLLALHGRFGGPPPFPIMPVLQGYTVEDYLRHIDMWGDRLTPGMWVGVGSVCKRQGNIAVIEDILSAIIQRRSDLRLHGFGIKLTALQSQRIRRLLHSADSMAWSYSARKQGRSANDWREAMAFALRAIEPPEAPDQPSLLALLDVVEPSLDGTRVPAHFHFRAASAQPPPLREATACRRSSSILARSMCTTVAARPWWRPSPTSRKPSWLCPSNFKPRSTPTPPSSPTPSTSWTPPPSC